LGLQLYRLAGEFEGDSDAMLAAIHKIGYRRIEGDLQLVAAPAFQQALKRSGIRCNSVHLNPMSLMPGSENAFAKSIDLAHSIGVRFAGIPIFPFSPEVFEKYKESPDKVLTRVASGMSAADWK